MKMMIVDDSMFIRSKIARETSLDGLEKIISARNGVEAVKLFRDTLPELVTMDLTMPEMDGVECIKELIKIKPDVIILVISAAGIRQSGKYFIIFSGSGTVNQYPQAARRFSGFWWRGFPPWKARRSAPGPQSA